jgi:hypothetical protein
VGFGLTSVSAQTQAAKGNEGNSSSATLVAQAGAVPPADFGAPPSGEIPILFNDHHVYAKPDRLKQNRVLAALVRGNTILVPLRSMFEQTGATVSYDPASKTVDVSKPGSDVKVTVGRPEVVINGESRPLDVPPEIYKGTVVVPLRVISEGMGAYVQWVPERKTVVVRYVAAPPPAPPPTATPIPPSPPPPPPSPTPTPKPAPTVYYEHFIVGDYLFDPKVYNEFSPGNKGNKFSSDSRAAIEFPLFGLPWMLEGDYREYQYVHNADLSTPFAQPATCPGSGAIPTAAAGDPGCVTVIGGYGQSYVQGFEAHETQLSGRFALKIADPRIYIGVGYLHLENNFGYPRQNGFGFGAEKLPDLDQTFSVYGSVYYYPSVSANYTYPADGYTTSTGLAGTSAKFAYRVLQYQIGAAITLTGKEAPFGLFLDGGFLGDSLRGKSLSPTDASHDGAYLGLGLKF